MMWDVSRDHKTDAIRNPRLTFPCDQMRAEGKRDLDSRSDRLEQCGVSPIMPPKGCAIGLFLSLSAAEMPCGTSHDDETVCCRTFAAAPQ